MVPYGPFERWAEARWKRRGDDYEAVKQWLSARLRADAFGYWQHRVHGVVHASHYPPLHELWSRRDLWARL